jgi:hypothetical protein
LQCVYTALNKCVNALPSSRLIKLQNFTLSTMPLSVQYGTNRPDELDYKFILPFKPTFEQLMSQLEQCPHKIHCIKALMQATSTTFVLYVTN